MGRSARPAVGSLPDWLALHN